MVFWCNCHCESGVLPLEAISWRFQLQIFLESGDCFATRCLKLAARNDMAKKGLYSEEMLNNDCKNRFVSGEKTFRV